MDFNDLFLNRRLNQFNFCSAVLCAGKFLCSSSLYSFHLFSFFSSISYLHLGGPNGSYFSVSHHTSQLLCQRFPLLGGQSFCLFLTDRKKKKRFDNCPCFSPYLQPPALFKKKKKVSLLRKVLCILVKKRSHRT